MRSFHFDLGNSSDGPVGFCARILAESPEEALDTLKEKIGDGSFPVRETQEEYLCVYINSDEITVNDIDDVEHNIDPPYDKVNQHPEHSLDKWCYRVRNYETAESYNDWVKIQLAGD